MKRALLGAAILLVAIAAVAYWSTRPRAPQTAAPSGASSRPAPRHVLLVTIDTLRADRLGSYGWTAARTPVLDALARRGTRFTRAYAIAPITLTSHATILTGRYPPGHAARHNGVPMQPDVPTLATRFKDAGFHTAAFVSAFPLDRRFGLNRAFDTYDDELPRSADGRAQNERAGRVTVDRAIAWIRERPADTRLFAWVHLFEPHAPYGSIDSNGQHRRSASERYDDEIATVDREIGRLFEAWRAVDESLVLVTADHGEAFGEHDEIGHSIFVYDTTLQVPLIVAGAGAPAGMVADAPVSLADIAPTIISRAQLPSLDADGIDLADVMRGVAAPERTLYAESFAPLLDFGWAPLRSIRRGPLKYIAAPRPELYDVRTDPHEQVNVVAERTDEVRDLALRVDRISGTVLPNRSAPADPDVLARLRALGYAGGGSEPAGPRPDPKDRIAIASRMAAVTSGELQGADAARALTQILREDARNVQAHVRLGFLLAENRQCDAAERHFAASIAGGLTSADGHLGLAMCQLARGAGSEALATFRDAQRIEPGNPVVAANVGLLELERGRVDAAITALRAALAVDPHLHQARFGLARALARAGDRESARREAADLLARLPPDAPQRPEVQRLLAALR